MKRNTAITFLSLGMAMVLAACSAGGGDTTSQTAANPFQETKGWVDSDLIGAVSKDTEYRLQDDFAAAVNKEWKLEKGDKYSDILQSVSDSVLEKEKKAVTDESIPGEEAEILRKYYALSSDWDWRNSQGIEPLKPYIEDINSISSMEELYAFFGDFNRNPLGLAPVGVNVMSDFRVEEYSDINMTVLGIPELSLTDSNGKMYYDEMNTVQALDFYEGRENEILYLLGRVGYSESEAKDVFKNCLKWEKKVFAADVDLDDEDMKKAVCEKDQVDALTGDFPLGQLLDAWGFTDTKYVMIAPRYAKKLSSLCSKRNLEKIKDYMIVNYGLSGR